jgi:hypothetical protein
VILYVRGTAVRASTIFVAPSRAHSQGGLFSRDQTEVTMGFVKLTLIGLSLLAGSFLLYEGLGADFRLLDEVGVDLEPYGISIGLALLLFSVLIDRMWTVD